MSAGAAAGAAANVQVVRVHVLPLACALFFAAAGAQAREPHRAPHPAGRQQTITYVTRAGDSLYNFGTRYLARPGDWQAIARLNHVSDPYHMRRGLALRVPVALLRRDGLSAKVIATNGPASHAFRAAPSLPLVVGTTLVEGDHVQTGDGGFATLEFADGTHLIIPPNTSLDLGTLRQTVLTGATDRIIDLKSGEVDSEVTHATKTDDRFQIRSPSVVAGVRGTRFRVNYDGGNGSTAVEVLDGAVGVDKAAAGQPGPAQGVPLAASAQLVAARHGSLTEAGGAVGAPVPLLAAPELAHPGKVQDNKTVVFDIVPVSAASGYRVQIGRDAGLLDMIGDRRSTSPNVDMGSLADGTYFVRIAAIDAKGLEGMPNVYAFERRSLALGTSAGRVAGSRAFSFRWFVDNGAPATRFRFVLGSTEDLHTPLIDHTDIATGGAVVNDLPKGVYYWTVIAEQFQNGRYYQKASPVQKFRIDW